MSSPVRRNSSKPFIDFRHQNGNGELNNRFRTDPADPAETPIPNVMTSPAIFPENFPENGYKTGSHPSRDIDEDTFSASSVTDVPKPPDGGWGWLVVFASFMIHVLGKKINRIFVFI